MDRWPLAGVPLEFINKAGLKPGATNEVKMKHVKHTPGPWRVTNTNSGELCVAQVDRLDLRIAVIHPDVPTHLTNGKAESLVNAHLIAAAPELVAALETVCKRLRIACEETPINQDYMLSAMHAGFEALLRKATGGAE